jgi:hypothetical protein
LLTDPPDSREDHSLGANGFWRRNDDFAQLSEKFAGLEHHLIAQCRFFRF